MAAAAGDIQTTLTMAYDGIGDGNLVCVNLAATFKQRDERRADGDPTLTVTWW